MKNENDILFGFTNNDDYYTPVFVKKLTTKEKIKEFFKNVKDMLIGVIFDFCILFGRILMFVSIIDIIRGIYGY